MMGREAQRWQPIETAPMDGSWVLLRAPSGYANTPYRVEVGRYDAVYRPHCPWQTSERRSFEDEWNLPTHWMPIIEDEEDK